MPTKSEIDIYLVEITVYDPAIAGEKTLYLSKGGSFITTPSETPANQEFQPCVDVPGNIQQFIYSRNRLGGASEVGAGVITVDNTDHSKDVWATYKFDGRPVIVRKGKKDSAYPSGFTTKIVGTMENIEFSWDKITIRLRDRQAEISSLELVTTRYAGTNSLPNGVEGVAGDLKGSYKPFLLGKVYNITPPLVNTSKLTYQISTAQGHGLTDVYDKGVALTPGTAHGTLAALQAATVPASTFDYYLGAGGDGFYFRLGTTPAGVVTCDAYAGATAADRTVAQLAYSIFIGAGGLVSGDVRSGTVAALDTDNDAEVGLWSGTEGMTVGDALDQLTQSIGAYWAIDRSGDFFFGLLDDPDVGSAIATYTKTHLYRESSTPVQFVTPRDDSKGLPTYSVTVGYQRNYTVQDESTLAGSAALTRINFTKQEFRKTDPAENATVKTLHPLSRAFETMTLMTTKADADAESLRLLDLYEINRFMINIQVWGGYTEDVNLGDVVTLELERFDWSSGKKFAVIGLTERYDESYTTLTLWG